MASPQTENGFVMVASDLFAAILAANLPNRCMIVLGYHLVRSYGPEKLRDVPLSPAEIHRATGLAAENARKAIRQLEAARILAPGGGNSYRFSKDYESWTPGGRPFAARLGGGPATFATWALARGAKAPKVARRRPPSTAPAPGPTGLGARSGGTGAPGPSGLDIQSNGTGAPGPTGLGTQSIGTGIEETVKPLTPTITDESLAGARLRASEDLIQRRENHPKNAGAGGVVVVLDDGTTIPIPPCPSDDECFAPPMSGSHAPTRDEVESTWAILWRHFGGDRETKERLGLGYLEKQRHHSHAVWHAAIREAYGARRTIRAIAYIDSIAYRFEREGIPEPRALAARGPEPIPSLPAPAPPCMRTLQITEEQRARVRNAKKPGSVAPSGAFTAIVRRGG